MLAYWILLVGSMISRVDLCSRDVIGLIRKDAVIFSLKRVKQLALNFVGPTLRMKISVQKSSELG